MELAPGSEEVEATTPIGQIRGEALTLIQTQKIVEFPVILMGEAYWRPVCAFLQRMVQEGTISESDLKLLLVTDSIEDAAAYIQTHAIEQFGLKRRRLPQRSWLLRE
jgi:predicted Rossmann-fold nucleotide-binding protein